MSRTGLKNKYCDFSALRNESDVEQFFLVPLLKDLGYGPDYLQTKVSIEQVKIGKGRKKHPYVPDYLGYANKSKAKPVLIIDAKNPNESAESGVEDAQLYASAVRRQMKPPKPEQYCVGVNGHLLIVKHFDSDTPIQTIKFVDFTDENPAFQQLLRTIGRSSLEALHRADRPNNLFEFQSVAPVELPAIFEACHRAIWKAEKRSPASAFYEFAKIMYVKIDQDKKVREYLDEHADQQIPAGFVPTEAVHFSTDWIEKQEGASENPINAMFVDLRKELQVQIDRGDKKQIFDKNEEIDLTPSTIKDVVSFLQHLDLYAVDEDLNGRLFETFLTATMRGEALGQFFTPRSVVKFMVAMARLNVTRDSMDMVLDGCCGTGGFLIQAMADMSGAIASNQALTPREQSALMKKVKTQNLWGIDAGKDPQMARIARLNMLLHKDGGSRIYFADALDKHLRAEKGVHLAELDELRREIVTDKTRFSCVLSNPPFSMTYERKKPNEWAILRDYTLAVDDDGKPRSSLRSSVMFLERYWDLLSDNGRLITVMDESVLNTLTARQFREYILKKFVLRAVISLPRNTFVKAQGQVKTSALYLRKKSDPNEAQPAVFMGIAENVGHTDSGKERPLLNELPAMLSTFQQFEQTGQLAEQSAKGFIVTDLEANNPTLRLDAHFFDPRYFATMHTLDDMAKEKTWTLETLGNLLVPGKGNLAGGGDASRRRVS
jgi:type I restriction enzyme M protein